jgi:ChpA-C
MKKARWISAVAGAAVLVAGFALPASAAVADGGGNGNAGVLSLLSGNDVNAPVSAPVNLCGVAVALLGGANAGCEGGAASNTAIIDPNGGSDNGNAGEAAVGSGNTVNAPVSAPVTVCGVAPAVGGLANAHCKGGSESNTIIANGGGSGSDNGNAGFAAVGSGNTVNAPVSAPVDVCGIAAAVVGFANASCQGGAFSNTLIG